MANRNGRYRAPMNDTTYALIWSRLLMGELGQDIAADLGINPGRVSEVRTGKRGSNVTGVRAA